ncbi:allophanate hydrolase subunit 2-domain-containing protein [Mariannaea sp. PMI_226]|nr:allophanate hydrolase subunit 2-domain-containing protein [Mariannaea sp. PMI_226]
MGHIDSTPLRNIRKVLVANRGEIAVRCIKACRELGVSSVAIITNADATSLHATLADEIVVLPGDDSTAYTNGEAILDICKRTNADAIIPGYGFLSENVEFAKAVSSAGITFVGPSAASINAMGLKHEARAIAEAANVPVIPGTQLLESAGAAKEAARRLGCPVMLKATGGGGGMGLQICHSEEDVEKAFAMVESRASTLFKNSGVFLEKYYPLSRHIEVQVAGNGEIVVAFGERECSLQRRHQKVIEECPSPFVERNPGLREKMLQAAVNYASQLKYKSVGTVEFLVDDVTADFFFLEMNTRLQVEHGITELCYEVDLVHLMLRQADYERGGELGIPSEVLKGLGRSQPLGSAIEARVYAEVPLRDFAPSPGVFQQVHWPEGEGVRVDTWVRNGQRITPLYDPLIGKVMAHSPDGRAAVRDRMLAALADTALQGTQSNLEYLSKILESEMFVTGNTLTNSLSTFKFDSCSLQVIDPGVFTTIQDYPGRIAVGHGVPPGGPMDDLSARVANILVGNDSGVELFEVTLSGPELLFHVAAVVAVCGAELPVTIDGASHPMWSRIVINRGQKLKLGKVTGDGIRTYLAVKGGLPQVPKFLGSKSTAPELGFGGVQGRKLQIHDILSLSPQSGAWATDATPLSLPSNIIPTFTTSATVCCIDGPYGSDDILTPEGRATLYETDWVVSHNSSRSGIRLEGPRLKWARTSGGGGGSHPSNVFDYGYPNGGVNFTGESPIIFAHDRPDLGGFVCPTTVCSGEMWKVGQLKPGNTVRFRSVSYENGLEISKRKDRFLQTLAVFSQATGATTNGQLSPLIIEIPDHTPSSVLHQKEPQGSHPRVTFRQGGDTSIIVEYGEQVSDLRNTACVQFLTKQISSANLPGVRGDANFSSLTVRFDPFQTDRSKLLEQLIQFDDQIGKTSTGIKVPARKVRLPVCLDHTSLQESAQRYMDNIRPTAAYMPDNVEYLRKNNALETRQRVFDALLKTPWLTVAVGFYVGTPILFPLDPWHVLTGQKYNPSRVYTPSGSVGLGGSLVAIYPVAAPGGYQLMGRTLGGWDGAGNRPGFSPERPWLFNHLDLIEFVEVSEEEYNKIERDFETGRYEFDISETTLDMDEYVAKFEAAAKDPDYQSWKKRQAAAAQEVGEHEQRLFDEWVAAKEAGNDTGAADGEDADAANAVSIESPLDANVWKVLVKPGDVLEKGQTVAVLEAMKMEINLVVSEDQAGAVVTKISHPPGSVVSPGSIVVRARKSSD